MRGDMFTIQGQLALDTLRADANSLISSNELKHLIGDVAYQAYLQSADIRAKEVEVLKNQLAIATSEGWTYWAAVKDVWGEFFKVWRLPEKNNNLCQIKRDFEHMVRTQHMPKLDLLWAGVSEQDRAMFYPANIHETFCQGRIPGLVIPRRDREKRDRSIVTATLAAKRSSKSAPQPIVLDWDFVLPKT